jgi:hypothetical protein
MISEMTVWELEITTPVVTLRSIFHSNEESLILINKKLDKFVLICKMYLKMKIVIIKVHLNAWAM